MMRFGRNGATLSYVSVQDAQSVYQASGSDRGPIDGIKCLAVSSLGGNFPLAYCSPKKERCLHGSQVCNSPRLAFH
jgi:hypothetical protein